MAPAEVEPAADPCWAADAAETASDWSCGMKGVLGGGTGGAAGAPWLAGGGGGAAAGKEDGSVDAVEAPVESVTGGAASTGAAAWGAAAWGAAAGAASAGAAAAGGAAAVVSVGAEAAAVGVAAALELLELSEPWPPPKRVPRAAPPATKPADFKKLRDSKFEDEALLDTIPGCGCDEDIEVSG